MLKILSLQKTKKDGCFLIPTIVQMSQKHLPNWSGNKTKQNLNVVDLITMFPLIFKFFVYFNIIFIIAVTIFLIFSKKNEPKVFTPHA